jgi:hypothetical protein
MSFYTYKNFVIMKFIITQFSFIIATNCRKLTGFMNGSYVIGHERASSLLCVVPIPRVLILF